MLNCHIVRDLLPSYLERLTSPETEAELTEHLSACPDCRAAKAAMEAVGVEPLVVPIRGGTDGAQLSFRGLLCPNIGTGGYCFHGPYEHITAEHLETAANTSAASIPISLDQAVRSGKLTDGMKIVMVGFGAGLTYGGTYCTWPNL